MVGKLVRIEVSLEQKQMMMKAFQVKKGTLNNILAGRTVRGRNGNADLIREAAISMYGGKKLYIK